MLRDNLVGLIAPMRNSAGVDPLALGIQKQASDDRPPCLENPRPEGAESSLTENVTSPFQAEPGQDTYRKHTQFLINRGGLNGSMQHSPEVLFAGVSMANFVRER
jgi:hypothetical protein